jgi:5-methylcytosine-specific restriction endonuclease McrA
MSEKYRHKMYHGMAYLDIEHLIESAKKKNSVGLKARHKLAILKRDGFKCVICGRTDTLTITHTIPPKRKQGRNSTSYKVEYCNTLCVDCHQIEDKIIDDLKMGKTYSRR